MAFKKYSPTYRVLFLYSFFVFVMSGLVVRLIDTQILSGKSFAVLAEQNKTYVVNQPEQRGVILDRYSDPMVFNKPIYYQLDSSESLYSEKTRISREEALQLMAQDPDLIRIEHEREYLYPQALSHVLGYIGSVSVEDLFSDSSIKISDKIGKMGLELHLQDYLKGINGYQKFEIDSMGVKQHLVAEEVGLPGQSIQTTIDPYLSQVAFEAMADKLGSVVILDAETGEVLTLISTPTFDLSTFGESTPTQEGEIERAKTIQAYFSHPQKLFFNRAISGAYPPGSVFKLMTALAGLENQKITSETTVLDEGVLEVGDFSYANWYFTQYGRTEGNISLQKAIARSNDIYFYKVAEWVGPEKLKEMAQMFGLGKPTGIQLISETSGLIPSPEWKQRVLGERWFLGNTYHFGIGQGDLLVSPIQIAQMVQGIANKGTICSPSLLSRDFKKNQILTDDTCGEVGVLRENLDLVVKGMLDACSSGGTGFPFFLYNDQVRNPSLNAYDEIDLGAVACKTGTSEFGPADEQGYRKTHGWFVATFGTQELINSLMSQEQNQADQVATDSGELQTQNLKDKWLAGVLKSGFPKKLVIAVLVESDEVNPFQEGSRDAGPVVKQIFDWMFADVVNIKQNLNEIPEYSTE
jgi:penicillin-binding protein 2